MNQEQIDGGLEQGKGRLKDAAGALLGDLKLQDSGKADQLRGQAQSLYGELIDRLGGLASGRPAAALAGAFGLGLALGLILSRD